MPNATAKALEQRLLRAFPPNQPYVPNDWRTAAVPRVVQSFLQHRLLEQLDEVIHSMRQEEMAWVNDSDPELESARAAFEEALRANGQIPESDWPRMVRQAADRNRGGCFGVLEGGYNHHVLGGNVRAFLRGMDAPPK